MKLDLHTHSTASDGQYSPTELIVQAKEKELIVREGSNKDGYWKILKQ